MLFFLLHFADSFFCCLTQVCDDEWHHYALNLEFPTVTLYVDGVSYDPALIHDNGLIHPPRPEPSIMIGACWAGESHSLRLALLIQANGSEGRARRGKKCWLGLNFAKYIAAIMSPWHQNHCGSFPLIN